MNIYKNILINIIKTKTLCTTTTLIVVYLGLRHSRESVRQRERDRLNCQRIFLKIYKTTAFEVVCFIFTRL